MTFGFWACQSAGVSDPPEYPPPDPVRLRSVGRQLRGRHVRVEDLEDADATPGAPAERRRGVADRAVRGGGCVSRRGRVDERCAVRRAAVEERRSAVTRRGVATLGVRREDGRPTARAGGGEEGESDQEARGVLQGHTGAHLVECPRSMTAMKENRTSYVVSMASQPWRPIGTSSPSGTLPRARRQHEQCPHDASPGVDEARPCKDEASRRPGGPARCLRRPGDAW